MNLLFVVLSGLISYNGLNYGRKSWWDQMDLKVDESCNSGHFLKKWFYSVVIFLFGWMVFSSLVGNVCFLGFMIRIRHLLFVYLVLFLILKLDFRLSIGLGLVSLATCLFGLVKGNEVIANRFAVLAYALLAVGIFVHLIEYFREVLFARRQE